MSSHRNTHIVCGSHWKLFIILWGPFASTEDGNFVSPVCHKEVNDSKNVEHRDPRIVRHDHKHNVKHVGVALPEWVFSALLTKFFAHMQKFRPESLDQSVVHAGKLSLQMAVSAKARGRLDDAHQMPQNSSAAGSTSAQFEHKGKITQTDTWKMHLIELVEQFLCQTAVFEQILFDHFNWPLDRH